MSYDTAATDPHHGGKMTFDMWLAWLEQIKRIGKSEKERRT